jgi:hypothetical protein
MRLALRCVAAGAVGMVLSVGSGCKALTDSGRPSASQMNRFAGELASAGMRSVGGAPVARAAPFAGPLSYIPVNINASFRLNCTAGGNITVTGNVSGGVNDQGTGLLSIGETETITAWNCDPPQVFDGDPYVTLTGTIPMQGGSLSPLGAQFSMGGGFRWSGSQSGQCSVNLSIIIMSNGSGHTTGMICGYQVDIST